MGADGGAKLGPKLVAVRRKREKDDDGEEKEEVPSAKAKSEVMQQQLAFYGRWKGEVPASPHRGSTPITGRPTSAAAKLLMAHISPPIKGHYCCGRERVLHPSRHFRGKPLRLLGLTRIKLFFVLCPTANCGRQGSPMGHTRLKQERKHTTLLTPQFVSRFYALWPWCNL